MRVDSRTRRAMSWPVESGGGWLGRSGLISAVSRASEKFARLDLSVADIGWDGGVAG